ncbi:hypothetical protein Poli38472_010748 [Pythium oligandrum]|uniref:SPIN90/Ldb17 leucine-rich domain-containing protein n=1 Tax=Pythium oligandrum TaxID=41045 RepID=A0A8K1CF65_PYTOL|nr:hypothetical protein Poli38472_010748 [Pythium oligandrum]|eukprot:TMW61685.1 hypothetical protein Poli38472_010748 [Pythium oligandrum]
MLIKGFLDSPPDESETLRMLQAIERQLQVCGDGTDWELAIQANHEQILRDLWAFLLDVVCTPLWLRIRAAELLNVCFTLRRDYLRVDRSKAHWLRSIVSSTCQLLDELDPRDKEQSTSLFHWMSFLEHLLLATDDSSIFQIVFKHSTYASMLSKMVRLLSNSSTQLFAATTICLSAFHRHEAHAGVQQHTPNGVLLDLVLSDASREGVQHVSGALLHVINSCGFPCPENRLSQLRDAIQLFCDVLRHPRVYQIVYLNDFKVLLDILLRECTDLPLEDALRDDYLGLLDLALGSALYLHSQTYRKAEFLKLLEDLLDAGTEADTTLSSSTTDTVKHILLERIDRLD